jgi:hypothetical protein
MTPGDIRKGYCAHAADRGEELHAAGKSRERAPQSTTCGVRTRRLREQQRLRAALTLSSVVQRSAGPSPGADDRRGPHRTPRAAQPASPPSRARRWPCDDSLPIHRHRRRMRGPCSDRDKPAGERHGQSGLCARASARGHRRPSDRRMRIPRCRTSATASPAPRGGSSLAHPRRRSTPPARTGRCRRTSDGPRRCRCC